MNETQQRPKIGFWVAVAVATMLAYPISFGPACWIDARAGLIQGAASKVYRPAVSLFYRPLLWIGTKNARIEAAVLSYASLGVTNGRSPYIVDNEIHWRGSFADFSDLIDLIRNTVKPETTIFSETPADDSDVDESAEME